jgi:hypothetical protein
MKLTLSVLFLLPFFAFAQDYVVLENGVQFNCKITSVTKDEVTVIRDSIAKRIPYYLVKRLEFNKSLQSENYPLRDSSISKPLVLEKESTSIPAIEMPELSAARAWNAASIVSGIAAVGFALYNSSISIPEMPKYDVNNPNKLSSDVEKYLKEVQAYAEQKDLSEKLMYLSATTSLLCALVSYSKVITVYETRKQSITFKGYNSGVSICYRF